MLGQPVVTSQAAASRQQLLRPDDRQLPVTASLFSRHTLRGDLVVPPPSCACVEASQ